MNDQTQVAAPEAVEETKTRIRPDLSRYVPDKSGSGKKTNRIDDFVARTLAGKTLEAIKQGATLLSIDHAKWEHLNVGQQRMLIGNALRNRLNDKKIPLSEQAITDVYGEPVAEFDHDAHAAAKAERAAKAAEKSEPEAEKAAEPEAEAPKKSRSKK